MKKQMDLILKQALKIVFSILLCGMCGLSNADDTEIYTGGNASPNLLFVLDASGSMKKKDGTSVSRLDRMKEALYELLDGLDGVNVGLMRFYRKGSDPQVQLIAEISEINTSREKLKTAVRAITLGESRAGGTPTVAALLESKRYFQGDTPYRGSTLDGKPTYTSPIIDQCAPNHIVVLTDGLPTPDKVVNSDINSAGLGPCAPQVDNKGTCGFELAKYLAESDLQPSILGQNNVTTHAIGFNIVTQWIKDVADYGGGLYKEAESANELIEAFNSIVDSAIESQSATFVPPTVSVDPSLLTNRDDIYLALFQPSNKPSWVGNLKRYRLAGSPAVVYDVNDVSAIDIESGSIKETAGSFWSSVIDGNQVGVGGAAEQLNAETRRVVTYLGETSALLDARNQVIESNALITTEILGVLDSSTRESVLKWARGVDVIDSDRDESITDTRHEIADPLHSRPVIVDYNTGASGDPDSVVFFGSNDSYLHAIEAATGNELYSYIPKSHLNKLPLSFENKSDGGKIYGIDGDITVWTHGTGANKNVYLYAGMRRGGRDYFALDITDKNNPKHLWTIEGGIGDFVELGQSWSKPVLGNIRVNNSVTPVIVFAGGYDEAQDHKSTRSGDSMGRAVFIVDATTGDLIWQASASNTSDLVIPSMLYSMPSDPTVIDIDGDGLIEQIYVGDTGGQIFRFDIDSENSFQSATGGVIASLAGTASADNRRFFNAPDVALINLDTTPFLSVSIGSGYRAHPLDTAIKDRFYMIRQPLYPYPGGYGVLESGSWSPITEKDLFDTTSNIIAEGDPVERQTAQQELASSQGWLMQLEGNGEKSLAASITLNHQVIFSTYLPTDSATACGAAIGSGRAYAVSIWDSTPAISSIDVNGDKEVKSDRHIDLKNNGIPPQPIPFFEKEQISILIGTEAIDGLDSGPLMRRTYWSELLNY